MSYLKINTGINEVVVRKCFSLEDNVTFYDVYDAPYYEEDGEETGMYIGEFSSLYDLEEQTEMFYNDLDEWLKEIH